MDTFSLQDFSVDDLIKFTGNFGVLQLICFAYNCMYLIYAGFSATICIFSGMQPNFVCSDGIHPENKCNDNCSSYIYFKPEGTMVAEFNLACGSRAFLNSMFTSGYWVGFLFGVLSSGHLLDKFGRKPVTILYIVGLNLSTLLMYIGNNIFILIVFRAMVGFFVSGGQIGAFVHVTEYLPAKNIASAAVLIQVIFSFGEMFAMLVGYMFKEDWKMQYLVATLPTPFLLLGSILLYPESCRWLLAVGKQTEAVKVADKLAIINGYSHFAGKIQLVDTKELSKHPALIYTWKDLFWPPKILLLSLSSFITWFAASIVYFGLTYGVQGLSGSIYINSFLMSLVEIPSFIAYILANKYGRKYPTVAFLSLSSVATVIMPFVKHVADGKIAVVLSMFGKFGSTAVFNMLFFYQVELFPSTVRATAIGFASMTARFAVISAPFIAKIGAISDYIPYIIFAIPPFVAALLILLFVPETNKKNLPETFDDVFARHDAKNKRSRGYSKLSIRSTNLVNE